MAAAAAFSSLPLAVIRIRFIPIAAGCFAAVQTAEIRRLHLTCGYTFSAAA
ncbi:hypothetical protein HFO94_01105 [Rhizobium leguminosarum]|nr:hypothetical protein [Rhizobium leguminosarum]